ncbi:glycosyltransferase [Calothrix sp. PCC 6303]|uniref:glycosyltransferase n=1 Tax=Calothrix sp. PCC 6303 TaxID=1170562 RepID=UPI0002A05911|nr:glycosyltransferase [Calothrix sp. PCC 6303]AFZ02673.1 hopene-associated glycosyltransferase HpnB [Calothrix sp. PCC 6303]
MNTMLVAVAFLSLLIWLFLLFFRGRFWDAKTILEKEEIRENTEFISNQVLNNFKFQKPLICAVIPARNEAELISATMGSLCDSLKVLGDISTKIYLVDDHSTDETAKIARETAASLNQQENFQIISAEPLPPGWSGKLWAMEQGIQAASKNTPDYILLTDADIQHHPDTIQRLINKAVIEDLDLVSVMVQLRCESFWEQLLIPAFVFFFQKLYPFFWVNNPSKSTAAAAGGCILIRHQALEGIGGIQVVKEALIDDCSLATAIKKKGKIWLGLSTSTLSLRPYPHLSNIWDMIARTAFTQLNYSPLLLVGTVIGMVIIYLVPVFALGYGILAANWLLAASGLGTYMIMIIAYTPTIRLYKCPPLFSLCLPIIGFLYTLMTIDSAFRHWQGKGGAWKGRVYQSTTR